MKIGHPPNYFVQVFLDSWEQDPEEAALYDGIITLSLNMVLTVRFVPDISAAGPPWRPGILSYRELTFATPDQAREFELYTSALSVTPNAEMAGHVGEISDHGRANLVFYVTPEEFGTYQRELDQLSDTASDAIPSVRRLDVLDRAVIHFVDTTVLHEPRVHDWYGERVGR